MTTPPLILSEKSKIAVCKKCKLPLGEIVEVRSPSGKFRGHWMKIGNLYVVVVSGRCASCGEEWFFSPADMKLKRLLAV